jgi:RimJ/RimL family protein N-acetyltransferase
VIRPALFPVLATARLDLRALEHEDAAQLFEVFSDPEVMRYWSTVPMRSAFEAEAMVAGSRDQFAAGTGMRWAVCRRDDARVMGTVSLFHFDEQNDRAEIGYALGRAFWCRGFMHEALTALVGHAFGAMDLRRLEADTDPRNAASIRALERLGFEREGLLRERWVVAGTVSDSLLFGLLRRDWAARQDAGVAGVHAQD